MGFFYNIDKKLVYDPLTLISNPGSVILCIHILYHFVLVNADTLYELALVVYTLQEQGNKVWQI